MGTGCCTHCCCSSPKPLLRCHLTAPWRPHTQRTHTHHHHCRHARAHTRARAPLPPVRACTRLCDTLLPLSLPGRTQRTQSNLGTVPHGTVHASGVSTSGAATSVTELGNSGWSTVCACAHATAAQPPHCARRCRLPITPPHRMSRAYQRSQSRTKRAGTRASREAARGRAQVVLAAPALCRSTDRAAQHYCVCRWVGDCGVCGVRGGVGGVNSMFVCLFGALHQLLVGLHHHSSSAPLSRERAHTHRQHRHRQHRQGSTWYTWWRRGVRPRARVTRGAQQRVPAALKRLFSPYNLNATCNTSGCHGGSSAARSSSARRIAAAHSCNQCQQ